MESPAITSIFVLQTPRLYQPQNQYRRLPKQCGACQAESELAKVGLFRPDMSTQHGTIQSLA